MININYNLQLALNLSPRFIYSTFLSTHLMLPNLPYYYYFVSGVQICANKSAPASSINSKMAASSVYLFHNLLTRRRDRNNPTHTLKSLFFFMPTTLALATSLLILLYISSTSNLFFIHPHRLRLTHPPSGASINHDKPARVAPLSPPKFVDLLKTPPFLERDGVLREGEEHNDFKPHMGSHGM